MTRDSLNDLEQRPVPHDPSETDKATCPLCDEPWPCAERKRQRVTKKALHAHLDAALYEVQRERQRIDGVEAIRYQSPLQWSADMTYGDRGIVMVVHTPTGDVRSDDATVGWLDEVLP